MDHTPSLRTVPAGAKPAPARALPASAWVFYAALLPVLCAIVGFGGVYVYIWAPVYAALYLAAGAWFLRLAWHQQPWPWHPILIPMLAYVLWITLQWFYPFSSYPGQTLNGLLALLACGCVFYLGLSALRSQKPILRLGWLLWLFTGCLAVEAVLQRFGSRNYIYGFHYAGYASPVGPFVYHNFFAGCMDLLWPVALVTAFRPAHEALSAWIVWSRRAMVPLLALLAVVFSLSRGGIMTLGVESLLMLLVFWREFPELRHARLGFGVVMIMLIAMLLLVNLHPVLRRFINLQNHDPSLVYRLRVAKTCLRIFAAHPWGGAGFSTFATMYPAYQSFDNGQIWLYAHNDYAQMLAETGLLGALCAAGFLLLWLRAFWHKWRGRGGQGPVRQLQLAAFIGMAGFLFHSFGDFQFHDPANSLLFYLMAALALAPVTMESRRTQVRFARLK